MTRETILDGDKDELPEDELAEIVRRSARMLGVEIDDESAVDIALRSRGRPRVANNLLRWVRDYADAKADGKINIEITQKAFDMASDGKT